MAGRLPPSSRSLAARPAPEKPRARWQLAAELRCDLLERLSAGATVDALTTELQHAVAATVAGQRKG